MTDIEKQQSQLETVDLIIKTAEKLKNAINTDYGVQTFADPTNPINSQTFDFSNSPSQRFYAELINKYSENLVKEYSPQPKKSRLSRLFNFIEI